MARPPQEPQALDAALERALDAARRGPLAGGNPRVGCTLLSPSGEILAVGYHRGAGTAHAEVDALSQLPRGGARGSCAVVTLEPCNHTGRTGPCSRALAEAGVARVIYALPDPNAEAAGGAAWLRGHGIEAIDARQAGIAPALIDRARDLNAAWCHAVARGRPWVIAKTAMSTDGIVAAADGTSQWITSPEARACGHEIRAGVDAIVVGTGTALADNPRLSARDRSGTALAHQPVRIVVGSRDLPEDSHLRAAGVEHVRDHDLAGLLERLGERGIRRVLIEGGPTLVSAALRAGVVDEWHVYRAPILLGQGRRAIAPLGIATLADALPIRLVNSRPVGADHLDIYAISQEARDVYRTR
ncbi:bifunctional diaminohydroxyphosphoribosylaminopyrimidine deaminase/5-amino-6-(5-phosphoribosylamino)uracil reductase RibD [Nanchangia anserum]|uniref:Riboflavin biosynthesis protein RibD n=1 Tax=Nanchangia anserum TaxID=2692125 RepID=A0A8I0GA97_9ACTO|nr:bifunctional diaminohydroxyphosphoribosylaminopyrimidine deaminase/5-amino-6-(5-phosphoribosylamino)uracil reductase RibD [Nanchangia anserum]MBD3689098.1 bifunctional diaminohydroxyphosphoribosylaminopyrimidine deaminase/5-amino-6-(5-phosphoribosylamino)uracil reductase RibD [Nanchangia anserum]QOX81335.1 bifunctional diaminohydroxyphosphoribosylaminopyrimidine deaminase/5-amino-6-(5-phosphoribosylamino)uracil reductase RibD [Nanchangia anserum]